MSSCCLRAWLAGIWTKQVHCQQARTPRKIPFAYTVHINLRVRLVHKRGTPFPVLCKTGHPRRPKRCTRVAGGLEPMEADCMLRTRQRPTGHTPSRRCRSLCRRCSLPASLSESLGPACNKWAAALARCALRRLEHTGIPGFTGVFMYCQGGTRTQSKQLHQWCRFDARQARVLCAQSAHCAAQCVQQPGSNCC